MRFKVIAHTISASGMRGDASDLSDPMELAAAQRELTALVSGKGARATSDGWVCQARDGTRYVVSLEPCAPVEIRTESLAARFHQARLA